VEEQRHRLPPPAKCQDPVEGVWMSHKFEAHFVPTEWYIFTLEIHRKSPGSNELTGTMLSHFWLGGPGDQNPPPCRPGRFEYVVRMPAEGTVTNGDQILFKGLSWRYDAKICGMGAAYNIDKFTGKIDAKIQEFQSVNNDGGRSVNDPMVFRRVKCFDQPSDEPNPTFRPVDVQPPPFKPPTKASCSKLPGSR